MKMDILPMGIMNIIIFIRRGKRNHHTVWVWMQTWDILFLQ